MGDINRREMRARRFCVCVCGRGGCVCVCVGGGCVCVCVWER